MTIDVLSPYQLMQDNTQGNYFMPLPEDFLPGDVRVAWLTSNRHFEYPVPDGWVSLGVRAGTAAGGRSFRIVARQLQEGDTGPTFTRTQIDSASSSWNVAALAATFRGADWDKLKIAAATITGANESTPNVPAPSIDTGLGELATAHFITRTSGTAANQGEWTIPNGMTQRAGLLANGAQGYNSLLCTESRTSGASGARTAVAGGSGGSWSAASLFIPELAAPDTAASMMHMGSH